MPPLGFLAGLLHFSYRWRCCLAVLLLRPRKAVITKQKEITLGTGGLPAFVVWAEWARIYASKLPGCKTQITLRCAVLQKEKRKDYI